MCLPRCLKVCAVLIVRGVLWVIDALWVPRLSRNWTWAHITLCKNCSRDCCSVYDGDPFAIVLYFRFCSQCISICDCVLFAIVLYLRLSSICDGPLSVIVFYLRWYSNFMLGCARLQYRSNVPVRTPIHIANRARSQIEVFRFVLITLTNRGVSICSHHTEERSWKVDNYDTESVRRVIRGSPIPLTLFPSCTDLVTRNNTRIWDVGI